MKSRLIPSHKVWAVVLASRAERSTWWDYLRYRLLRLWTRLCGFALR